MKPDWIDWVAGIALAVLVALVGALITDEDGHLTLRTDPAALREAQVANHATR